MWGLQKSPTLAIVDMLVGEASSPLPEAEVDLEGHKFSSGLLASCGRVGAALEGFPLGLRE